MTDSGNGSDDKTKPDHASPIPDWEMLCKLVLDTKTELLNQMGEVVDVHRRREIHWTNKISELTAQNIRLHEDFSRYTHSNDARLDQIERRFDKLEDRIEKLAAEGAPTMPAPGPRSTSE